MFALQNPQSGAVYTYRPSETNGRVKVTYHRFPNVHYQGVGHWRDGERARRHYRELRKAGWQPVAVESVEVERAI